MKHLISISTAMLLCVALTACNTKPNSVVTSGEITVISREDGSGTRGAFTELFGIELKGDNGTRKDLTTKEAIVVNKTDIVLNNVISNPLSIGYISIGSLNDKVKAIDIDNAAVTSENIINGSYSIARPFNIATGADISPLAQDFIDFMLSKEGQLVVSKSYIAVNQNPVPYAGFYPEGKIVVAGSSSVTPVMEKLKEAYIIVNPNASIEIQQSDSSTGLQAVINGTADIAMSSRDLKDSERSKLTPVEIAIDGIAVIVNKNNSISSLTKAQVNDIFTGTILDWAELI